MKYSVEEIKYREHIEPLGTKPKFWFTKEDDGIFLCKIGRPNTGENWAEKAAYELSKLLGIPSAKYELAIFQQQQAIVTPRFLDSNASLIHGNELLALFSKRYDKKRRFELKQYQLETVINNLKLLEKVTFTDASNIRLPIEDHSLLAPSGVMELFLTYLLFDAWIGNQDRHDENWGLIRGFGSAYFTPSYDHASSLACRLSDEEREKRLSTKDGNYGLKAFAKKAKTPFFDHQGKRIGTIDAFQQAVKLAKKGEASKNWLERLDAITDDQIRTVFDRFPDDWISDITIAFTIQYLAENRQRLLNLGGFD